MIKRLSLGHSIYALAFFATLGCVTYFAVGTTNAAILYWDANSSLAGNGTWDDNTTQNWRSVNSAGAPDSKWTPNNGTLDAQFGGATAYTATVASGTTINANSLTFAPTA